MIIGTTEILLSVLVVLIAYIAYTLIKQLRTLEKSKAWRLLDLMVIGTILYLLDIFMPKTLGGQTIILRTAGMLIFLYGYGFLILEKYREGRREVK
jgi:hypothetical protein